jgi:hypothetical protein
MENFKKLFRVVNYATYLLILLVLIAALFDQKILEVLEDFYFRWVFYMLILEAWITVVSRNEENS